MIHLDNCTATVQNLFGCLELVALYDSDGRIILDCIAEASRLTPTRCDLVKVSGVQVTSTDHGTNSNDSAMIEYVSNNYAIATLEGLTFHQLEINGETVECMVRVSKLELDTQRQSVRAFARTTAFQIKSEEMHQLELAGIPESFYLNDLTAMLRRNRAGTLILMLLLDTDNEILYADKSELSDLKSGDVIEWVMDVRADTVTAFNNMESLDQFALIPFMLSDGSFEVSLHPSNRKVSSLCRVSIFKPDYFRNTSFHAQSI